MKRMGCPGIAIKDLFLGSVVTLHSRQLKLVDFADLFTRNKFEGASERSFAMIKPDCYTATGKIIDAIYQNGFKIGKLKMSKFSFSANAWFPISLHFGGIKTFSKSHS